MKVYNYSEARQNFATLLNTALKEEVIIARKDGSKFKLVSINENKEIGKLSRPGVKLTLGEKNEEGICNLQRSVQDASCGGD